jgi:glycosyltransferase involved in cell wall biosynthesis
MCHAGRADESPGTDPRGDAERTPLVVVHGERHEMTHRRPRLLVVASTFPGQLGDGTPEFIRDLSLRLGATFDVTVLVPRVPGAPEREVVDGVTIERFAYFPRRWEDLAHGAIIENLRAKPSRWLQVAPFVAAETIALRRLVRRHRPDVLHVHWVIPQGVAALLAARRTPWVVTTLGGDVYAMNNAFANRLKRAVLRRARAVTTMNADMRDRLVDLGARPETTYVQFFGAELRAIRAGGAGEARVPGRIVFVGRLAEKKGVSVLIDALRRLPSDLEWSLEIVGDGPLRGALTTQARGLPVQFSGAASREEIARAYARSSVVAVPSVPARSGDQDGLPTVLVEAMGSACAIVASDLPGLNEALDHGVTGLLVPPNDPDKLAGALSELLADSELRSRLGAAALARSDEFGVEACAERYVEILATAGEVQLSDRAPG